MTATTSEPEQPVTSTETPAPGSIERASASSADASATPTDGAPTARPWPALALAAALLLSLVVLGVVGWQAFGASRARSVPEEAVAAARVEVPQVLSFQAQSLDADVGRARSLVSGGFAAQFNQMLDRVIGPAVKQDGMATKAEVVRAAATDEVSVDNVTVLVFVHQSTSSTGMPQAEAGVNQMKVTMTRAGGGWLISDIQPL